MKVILLSLVALFTFTQGNAQLQFGVRSKVAFNQTSPQSITLQNIAPVESIDMQFSTNSINYGAGGFVYADNDLLFFMTEFLYEKTKSDFSLSSDINDLRRAVSTREFSIEKSTISIPVTAGLKISNFKLGLGPVFNFKIDQSENLGEMEAFSVQSDNFDAGFQFLVGYKLLDRIHIDVVKEIAFGRVTDDISYRNQPIEMDNSRTNISLRLGLLF